MRIQFPIYGTQPDATSISQFIILRPTTMDANMITFGKVTKVALLILLSIDRFQELSALSIRDSAKNSSRRRFVRIASAAAAVGFLLPKEAHATRAVGGAEIECREAGNCLEKLELDGALGWNWGAKDRKYARPAVCRAALIEYWTLFLPFVPNFHFSLLDSLCTCRL